MNHKLDVLNLLCDGHRRITKGFCKNVLAINLPHYRGYEAYEPHEDSSHYCTIGAISVKRNWYNIMPLDAEDVLYEFLPESFQIRVSLTRLIRQYIRQSIINYNNHKDTTQQDVLNLFQKAINKLEGEILMENEFIDSWEVEIQAQTFDLVGAGREAVCV